MAELTTSNFLKLHARPPPGLRFVCRTLNVDFTWLR